MSASQFDDLLGDFGESTTITHKTSTHKTSTHATFDDDFDLFEPPKPVVHTSHDHDSELLLDFSTDSEIKNGETSGGVEQSSNPFYDMSSDTKSANPFYDFGSGSANPLYDLSSHEDTNDSSNPLYEFTTTTSHSPSNPMYGAFDSDEAEEEVDLLSGTNEVQEEDEDYEQSNIHHYDDSHFQEKLQGQQEREFVSFEHDAREYNDEDSYHEQEEQHHEDRHQEQHHEDRHHEEQHHEERHHEHDEDDNKYSHVDVVEEALTDDDYPDDDTIASDFLAGGNAEERMHSPQEGDLLEEDVPKLITFPGMASVCEEDADEWQQGQMDDGQFSRDRAEEDLENYCMDREDSDHSDDVSEILAESAKSRDDRSRSPSRNVQLDKTWEGHAASGMSDWVNDDAEVETPRFREIRSHDPSRSLEPQDRPQEDEFHEGGRTVISVTRTETRYSGSGLDNSQTSEDFSSNHWDEERSHQNTDYGRPQSGEQDIIHFSEMSTTKNKFESDPKPTPRKQISVQKEVHSSEGGVYENEPQTFQQWQNEVEDEEGVHESQPQRRDDVVREADSDKTADLPPIGTAQSMRARFMSAQNESTSHSKHDVPTHHGTGGEYVSEPRGYVEKYEGKAESGVFESEPVHNPDVVRSGEELKEDLPERGMAKNLANRFRQISSESSSVSVTKSKRDITPERSAHKEYVSEPRSQQTNDYDVRVDAGVFENQPQRSADVVTSDSVPEDYIPERGFAKNVAAKFREMESTVKSPPHSPIRKREITPPRETDKSHQAVVVENSPEYTPDIVHASDPLEEALPERGMAKNIALRFRQMEAENKSPSSPKAKKDLTPPPKDSGVYENQPKQFHADYTRPVESAVVENQPVRRDDVVRGDEPPRFEEELPERGAAKNLVNKWRQMESEGAKLKSPGSSGRPKDFTPPREEPRASQQRKSPRTPLSPSGHGQMDNGSVHPSDLPGQYQPQIEASVFESSPQERSDAAREGDTDLTDGMPKKDTAKKMLARFQSIQAEANKQAPGPALRKDSECSESEIFDMMENAKENFEDENKVGRSKSMRAAIQMEKCGACEKTVYAMERLEMNKRVYHKACFRCTQCKAVLTPKTFAINNDIIFCTTHYKQLFATKGNYDEGFGRMQHKKRWNSNPNLTKDEEDDDKS